MAEYIEREAAIKAIEAYGTTNGNAIGYHSGAVDCAIAKIETLPAADVVEVVRCRDCKWTDNVFFKTKVIWCDHDEQWVEEDNFCKYGSRRESDETD